MNLEKDRSGTSKLDSTVVALGQREAQPAKPALGSSPLLAAVSRAGTKHVYGDTASVEELGSLITLGDGSIAGEVDGNTANQPLVRKVIEQYLSGNEPATWAKELRSTDGSLSEEELTPLLYAIVCGRVGNDVALRFAAGRPWQVSLQLHMNLGADAEKAKRVGRYLRRMVPSAVVKVPFTPHQPHCFLIARDLEREGIPVNFTSTFSARQVVAAALLADVTLTNIFMGRINQGLKADLLGEHVDLEAQRALLQLRRDGEVKTLLIVASVREWQTFLRVAGCDAFTAPCDAIRDFMAQTEIPAEDVKSQLETSYEDRLGIDPEVLETAGKDAIERLYRVEPDLIRFLVEFRGSKDYRDLSDGDRLFRHFERAGFGDLFHAPSASEWQELRKNKLPDLQAPITKRLPMDTLYTLLADADFEKYQEEMDDLIRTSIGK